MRSRLRFRRRGFGWLCLGRLAVSALGWATGIAAGAGAGADAVAGISDIGGGGWVFATSTGGGADVSALGWVTGAGVGAGSAPMPSPAFRAQAEQAGCWRSTGGGATFRPWAGWPALAPALAWRRCRCRLFGRRRRWWFDFRDFGRWCAWLGRLDYDGLVSDVAATATVGGASTLAAAGSGFGAGAGSGCGFLPEMISGATVEVGVLRTASRSSLCAVSAIFASPAQARHLQRPRGRVDGIVAHLAVPGA